MRTKIAILLIVTFAIAAVGAGWKWHSHKGAAEPVPDRRLDVGRGLRR